MATESQGNKPLLDGKEWQTMTPLPVASAIGTVMIHSKNGANNISLLMLSGTVHYLYHHDEDMYLQIPSGAFGGTWVAGVCGIYHPWSKTITANGGSTTTITVASATFNLCGFVRGAQVEFLTGTAANVGVRTTITEILTNAGSGNITLTLADTVTTVVNTDTFRIGSGRFFVMASGTLATGTFKEFDLATMSWANKAYATGGTTNGTDARLVVPYMSSAIFDTGTAAAATSSTTTLTCTGKTWVTNQWVNYQVRISAGTGVGQVNVITANDGDTLTWVGADIAPDDTSVFAIEGDENAIYYLGNGAVTMYKYSISGDVWGANSVTAARAGAPVAGMSADWVGVTGDTGWDDVSNIKDGRYIYSLRGTSTIIDRYDIATKAWLATTGVIYVNTLNTFNNGDSTFWDGIYIYILKEGTAAIPIRIFKYNVRSNYLEPFAEDWYLGGAAVVGNKLWVKDLSKAGLVRWVYYISGTSTIVRRIMII